MGNGVKAHLMRIIRDLIQPCFGHNLDKKSKRACIWKSQKNYYLEKQNW